MDVDKWSNIITPVCVGSKNVSELINKCKIAIKEVTAAADIWTTTIIIKNNKFKVGR